VPHALGAGVRKPSQKPTCVVTKLPYVIVYNLDWETETIVVHGARER
jgi:hypothetical protein